MRIHITALLPDDWPTVRAIYIEGIATSLATFETEVPEWEAWDRTHLEVGRLAARRAGEILGWCALSRVSARNAYAGVAEVSVYVTATARGQGVGKALLEAQIAASEDAGIWTLQATIIAENKASLSLHHTCGFREVGRREKIARLGGEWRDTILLERRSGRVL